MKTRLICPACNSTQVKEIAYGMPDFESFDFEKYEVGGCCVTDNDPKYLCKSCSKSW
jgi:transposase-like protein